MARSSICQALALLLLSGVLLGRQQTRSYFPPTDFTTPSIPLLPSIADCERLRSEWEDIVNQIQRESQSCATANMNRPQSGTAGPCCWEAFGNMFVAAPSCATYPACAALDRQFWCATQDATKAARACSDRFRLAKLFDKVEVSTDDQEKLKSIETAILEAAKRSFRDPVRRKIAGESLEKSQRVMQNALDQYIKTMDAAVDQNRKDTEEARQAERPPTHESADSNVPQSGTLSDDASRLKAIQGSWSCNQETYSSWDLTVRGSQAITTTVHRRTRERESWTSILSGKVGPDTWFYAQSRYGAIFLMDDARGHNSRYTVVDGSVALASHSLVPCRRQ